jgi:GH15 family glucan-1,4-alpha-glucosidase
LAGKIEDYGLIGDCTTAALVGRDGSIDWLCWPHFDSDACFAALLGSEKHGRWQIAPSEKILAIARRYRGDTLILETTYTTEGGEVVLIDFMPGHRQSSDVVRLVRCTRGRVKMRMELIIRFGLGYNIPWVRRIEGGAHLAISGPDMLVLRTPVKTRGEDMRTLADFDVREGETIPFALTYAASHLPVPEPFDTQESLQKTDEFWQEWSKHCNYEGTYRAIVMRSLLTLKALTFAPTGGIVAAPTTSLPERPGGESNWDYRYCWLRDATFTLLALMNSGYYEEALAWHNWLLRSVAGSPADMQIMYGITGKRRLLEWQANWLPGYEGAQPVRIGNAAHAQLQLDVFGELMDVFHQSRTAKLKLTDESWDVECELLKHLAKIWREPDCGMWERRGTPKHYVSSKILTWVAFDRGIKSAKQFGLKAPLDAWRKTRDEICVDVCENGFDRKLNSFMESYGSDLLDASVLLAPSVGFLPPDDPRILGTLEATEKYLVRDDLVMRHDPREKSERARPDEGAFLACTLWLADAYVLTGKLDRAQKLFDRVANLANDIGLLAEEYDLGARRQAGNFPQALTHIALINTAHNITKANKPAVQRAAQDSSDATGADNAADMPPSRLRKIS